MSASLFNLTQFRLVCEKTGGLAKIICIHVVFLTAMMNELLKIQQDMGAPQQQQRRQQAAVPDEDAADIVADPDDWVATQSSGSATISAASSSGTAAC